MMNKSHLIILIVVANMVFLYSIGENIQNWLSMCKFGVFFATKCSRWVRICNIKDYGRESQTPSDIWDGLCNYQIDSL